MLWLVIKEKFKKNNNKIFFLKHLKKIIKDERITKWNQNSYFNIALLVKLKNRWINKKNKKFIGKLMKQYLNGINQLLSTDGNFSRIEGIGWPARSDRPPGRSTLGHNLLIKCTPSSIYTLWYSMILSGSDRKYRNNLSVYTLTREPPC